VDRRRSPVNLQPLGDRVVVDVLEPEEISASGIVIPDNAREKPQRGRVLAVGKGRYEDGTLIPVDLSVDDEVVYSKYGGTEVSIDGEDYLLLRETDVLATVVRSPVTA
jgi:chaperonin GroES